MKKVPIVMGILLLLVISIIVVFTLGKSNVSDTSRPKYCQEGKCIEDAVFSELPAYPEDFKSVYTAVYMDAYNLMENFSIRYPDENYFNQPEFYGEESFVKTGVQYYTSKPLIWGAGGGPYRADWIISNVSVGDTFPVVTYWHNGWSVYKYQAFQLVPEFPESATIRLGDYKVVQDPEQAKACFDININPNNLLLSPTYPIFYQGWTQKIVAEITPKCSGDWVINIVAVKPTPEFKSDIIYKYGILNISSIITGASWQIFVSID